MTPRRLITLLAVTATLAGCAVDPHAAADRRAALTSKVFPEPYDRQGVFMTFPMESGGLYRVLEVIWYPSEVTEFEITRRVEGFCRRQNTQRLNGQVGVRKDLGTSTRTLPDGQVKTVRQVFFECL
ncbi:hypothetical protein [Tropicimonas sp. S265A]|uniref:hypothetical protein n=1 Tax=Tropicimonas sp. S265A TaxID=3415134 RepID=UPI003C7B39B7